MTKATQKRVIIVLVNHRTRKPIIDQYHFSLKIQNKRNLSAEHLSRVWLFVDGQLAAHYSNLRISEAAKVTTTRERDGDSERGGGGGSTWLLHIQLALAPPQPCDPATGIVWFWRNFGELQ